jgi:hypothetical protein
MSLSICSDDDVEAMVAADSFPLLVQRIQPMVTAGRRMVLAVREFTYLHRPPRLYAGLTLDTSARDGGVWTDTRDQQLWCGIVLTNGGDRWEDRIGLGFGESVHEYSGNTTQAEAWARYHKHQAEAANHFDRRRDMTHIAINGGLPGFRYRNTDQIVITEWNRDGVATEKVLAFEPKDGAW